MPFLSAGGGRSTHLPLAADLIMYTPPSTIGAVVTGVAVGAGVAAGGGGTVGRGGIGVGVAPMLGAEVYAGSKRHFWLLFPSYPQI